MASSRRQTVAHRVTTVAFAVLVATPWFLTRNDERHAGAKGGTTTQYGFVLTEAAKAAGIEFTHLSPEVDPKIGHIAPYVAALGASVSIVDYDGDGYFDIYTTQSRTGARNRLYRNNRDGAFTDVAERAGLGDLNRPEAGVSMGTAWGDFDNDGHPDMFLYRWGKTALYRNRGDGTFADVTERAGFGRWVNANAATWFDFDNDGDLDLYVGGYYPEHLNLANLRTTRLLADSFEYATNGGRSYLFRNRGDGTFEDVSVPMNAIVRRWTLAVCAVDLNGDGWQDLYVANDYGYNVVLVNREGKRFEHHRPGGIGSKPKSGMNASVGDIANAGSLVVFVTNITKTGYLAQGNDLWSDVLGRSVNIAVPSGVANTGWAWGAQFGDLNNDGWLDLYVTNGFISADPHADYWYDMAKLAQGTGAVFEDARNWPPIGNRSLSGHERSAVFLNDGAGGFHDVAASVGATDTYDGRAIALGDLDRNGSLDIVVANQRGPLLLYRNAVDPARAWIAFDLKGTRSNRDAYGALVTLYWNATQQTAALTSASGFSSQNARLVHFGLGPTPEIHRAVIRWPSGIVQSIEAARAEPRAPDRRTV